MKYLFPLLSLLTLTASAQRMTLAQWDNASISDKKLLPKYGHKPKSTEEVLSDHRFIYSILTMPENDGNKRKASNHMIGLGFDYMYRGDLKTAMYRFNQAYLLDSTNTDIYWGYGAIYMTLEDYKRAKKQYVQGLSLDSTSTHLITDYSTYYMALFFNSYELPDHGVIENKKQDEKELLDTALALLLKSYHLDPKDQNTVYKMSTVYYYLGDCLNATKFFKECKRLGGRPITKQYTSDLKKKCK